MSKCPHCRSELIESKNNEGKLLCYTCKKRYDSKEIEEYWQKVSQAQAKNQASSQQMSDQKLGLVSTAQEYEYDYPHDATGMETLGAYTFSNRPRPDYSSPEKRSGIAIVALVLAIVGILGFWIPIFNLVSILLCIASIVVGVMAKKKADAGEATGKRLALASIIAGATGIVLSLVVTVMTVLGIGFIVANSDDSAYEEITNAMYQEYDEKETSDDDFLFDEDVASYEGQYLLAALEDDGTGGTTYTYDEVKDLGLQEMITLNLDASGNGTLIIDNSTQLDVSIDPAKSTFTIHTKDGDNTIDCYMVQVGPYAEIDVNIPNMGSVVLTRGSMDDIDMGDTVEGDDLEEEDYIEGNDEIDLDYVPADENTELDPGFFVDPE